jgi:AcrR family transcriptional regulator
MNKGHDTRQALLAAASDIASQQGLGGLSIGQLAQALEMSKSGVFAHFGSKQELQLAVLEYGWGILGPRLHHHGAPEGIAQLRAVLAGWLEYLRHCPFAGGCLLLAASTELDGQPGPVRDQLLRIVYTAVGLLQQPIETAQRLGQLRPDCHSEQLAFELHAFLQAANNAYQLTNDARYFDFAATAIERSLQSHAADILGGNDE